MPSAQVGTQINAHTWVPIFPTYTYSFVLGQLWTEGLYFRAEDTNARRSREFGLSPNILYEAKSVETSDLYCSHQGQPNRL